MAVGRNQIGKRGPRKDANPQRKEVMKLCGLASLREKISGREIAEHLSLLTPHAVG